MIRVLKSAAWLTGSLLLTGCATADRPQIKEVTPRITRIDWESVEMVLDVHVNNPYAAPLHVPSFHYAIDIQGQEYFASKTPGTAHLPARKIGSIPLPVRFEYRGLRQAYENLSDASEIDYELRTAFAATVQGETYELPVSFAGTVPVLRLPEITFASVDFPHVSMTGAHVTADVRVHNPNIFELGFGEVGYHLSFGDIPVTALIATTSDTIGAGESGVLDLEGQITGQAVLARLLAGGSLGRPTLILIGRLETPWGSVSIADP